MWKPHTIQWSYEAPLLLAGIGQGKLAVFVGNGLSRLADPPAPSWEDLFRDEAAKKVLRREGVSLDRELARGGSLLDVAEVVSKDPSVWKQCVGKLHDWATGNPQPCVAHELIAALKPRVVLTTNLDKLLEPVLAAGGGHLYYLHGKPGDPSDKWILTRTQYLKNRRSVVRKVSEVLQPGTVALFVGYGHSPEDFDVIQVLHELKPNPDIHVFSLVPEDETKGLAGFRNLTLGVTQVTYSLPKAATPDERRLALGTALLDLCEASGINCGRSLPAQIETLRRKLDEIERSITLVAGLAAMNVVSLCPEGMESETPFPEHRRYSIKRKELSEPGGPGLIVSRILASLGFPVALASRIADDEEGKRIWDSLAKERLEGKPLFLDYLERREPSVPDQQTWKSYILVHPSDGQRVFMDRVVDPGFFTLDQRPTLDSIGGQGFCALYFDRFMRGQIQQILRPPLRPLAEDTWTFYHSGEHGDRFSEANAQYYYEDKIAKDNINFALCSFRFAQWYLCHHLGKVPESLREDWAKDRCSSEDEGECLERLLNTTELRDRFVQYLQKGARHWLRSTPPRVVVVTLHDQGCLWVDVDTGRWERVATPGLLGRVVSTASAGDTFEGALVAAVLHVRNQGIAAAELPNYLTRICEFANQAAARKTRERLVSDALENIKKDFISWKKRIADP